MFARLVKPFAKKISGFSLTQKRFQSTSNAPKRVTITGATGNIAYSLIFRIASGEMLGPNQPVIIQLLDIEPMQQKLKGVEMELLDCAFPLVHKIVTTSDEKRAFEGVDYALLVGGKPRGKGQERADMLKDNGSIFRVQGKALNEVANKNARIVVVGNPANTNCLIAAMNAPNLPKTNFSAMMRLDHNRALAQLAQKTHSNIGNIERLCVWGNHSATQYPDISHTTINGTPALQMVDKDWVEKDFIPTVANRGAAIINARGASSATSAADAALKHMRDWALGTQKKGDWVSMGVWTNGNKYGVEENLYAGLPTICTGNGNYEVVQNVSVNAFSQDKIQKSINELKQERETVKALFS